MKVAFAVSEAVPYAKTGGLADVAGALPGNLGKVGVKADVFMPAYKDIEAPVIETITVTAGAQHDVKISRRDNYFFIDAPGFFDREGLYGDSRGDYPDNCERFAVFCRAVKEFVGSRGYDIVHCHDWQSGLIPVYLREGASTARSIFTIHNLGYQGRFPGNKYSLLGLKPEYFSIEGVEFYGDISFLKAGIVFSDIVTTVSENYAREIQTTEYGLGMEGVLKKRRGQLFGIINGLDYEIWNPATDREIYYPYRDIDGKHRNKEALNRELGLDTAAPLIGMVSRIADQKGFDLLMKIFDDLIGIGFNIVILGTGDQSIQQKLLDYSSAYPTRVSVHLKFDNRLAHRIYAGSDFFAMPSRYEPCGLGQLIAFKYGSIPIVRATGGLADTVIDLDQDRENGGGISFSEYDRHALLAALKRAYRLYCRKDDCVRIASRIMAFDFSWERAAGRYKQLYDDVLALPSTS